MLMRLFLIFSFFLFQGENFFRSIIFLLEFLKCVGKNVGIGVIFRVVGTLVMVCESYLIRCCQCTHEHSESVCIFFTTYLKFTLKFASVEVPKFCFTCLFMFSLVLSQ